MVAVPDPRDVARAALSHYDLTPRRLTLAAESFNTVFRVTADSGTYALRIGSALQIHAERTLHAEAAWLDRLQGHRLKVPVVRRTRDGQVGTMVDTRVCGLFDWVAGRSLRTRLSGSTVAALGRLAARLHQDAEEWRPTEPIEVPAADRVLY
jgi:Ser/Thr protein kinase RdoA (MazF antagonist)